MDPLGKSPIPVPALILGKVAMGSCWLFFVVKRMRPDLMLYDSAVTRGIGLALCAGGILLAILSFVYLGDSISVGIPRVKTKLKTGGVYQLSRNPLYLGGFLIGAGSCLFSIHPLNLVLLGATIGIHHRIVKKEEEFLEKTFGPQWLDYRQRVPRYIGWIGKSGNARHRPEVVK